MAPEDFEMRGPVRPPDPPRSLMIAAVFAVMAGLCTLMVTFAGPVLGVPDRLRYLPSLVLIVVAVVFLIRDAVEGRRRR